MGHTSQHSWSFSAELVQLSPRHLELSQPLRSMIFGINLNSREGVLPKEEDCLYEHRGIVGKLHSLMHQAHGQTMGLRTTSSSESTSSKG